MIFHESSSLRNSNNWPSVVIDHGLKNFNEFPMYNLKKGIKSLVSLGPVFRILHSLWFLTVSRHRLQTLLKCKYMTMQYTRLKTVILFVIFSSVMSVSRPVFMGFGLISQRSRSCPAVQRSRSRLLYRDHKTWRYFFILNRGIKKHSIGSRFQYLQWKKDVFCVEKYLTRKIIGLGLGLGLGF